MYIHAVHVENEMRCSVSDGGMFRLNECRLKNIISRTCKPNVSIVTTLSSQCACLLYTSDAADE